MDPKYSDYRVTQACFYEALPHPSGIHWGEVVPKPSRPASTQSLPSGDAVDTDDKCRIAQSCTIIASKNTLTWDYRDHQIKAFYSVSFPIISRCGTHTQLALKSSLRSADVSANTVHAKSILHKSEYLSTL